MKNSFSVIFDMDGVIVDNYAYHQEAWKIFCGRHGVDFSRAFRSKVFGGTNRDHLETFFQRTLSAKEVANYEHEKESIYRSLYRDHIRPVQGLLPFLKELGHAGVRMALATSSPPVNVRFVLAETGLAFYFSTILDATSVVNGKPDPEIFLKTAMALNAEPEECIVFEDSINGIAAACAAGMKVIALATTHSAAELHGVERIIQDFDEISLEELELLV